MTNHTLCTAVTHYLGDWSPIVRYIQHSLITRGRGLLVQAEKLYSCCAPAYVRQALGNVFALLAFGAAYFEQPFHAHERSSRTGGGIILATTAAAATPTTPAAPAAASGGTATSVSA